MLMPIRKIPKPGKVRKMNASVRRFNAAEIIQALEVPSAYQPPTLALLMDGKVRWERERKLNESGAEMFIKRAYPAARIEFVSRLPKREDGSQTEIVLFSVPVPNEKG